MLIQKSIEFNIDLNAKTNRGETAFHFVCYGGHETIVKMMIENAKFFKIDLTSKNNCGDNGFQIAKNWGHTNTANIIEKMLSIEK